MNHVYIALGSNLADPLYQINTAFTALDNLPDTIRIATSSLYQTSPYGSSLNQSDYLNAVVELETLLEPDILLQYIQHIELKHGRERKKDRWGPRTLDLDILLFGKALINTINLIIPHYDMHNRPFMLIPLIEIAPQLSLPNGHSLIQLISNLDCSTVHPWLK
ncbi:2-amino-4-hydroxy-6-hydroxymethyldihydropteridine diphosphokinase [Pantoea sp. Mhis]|uniref:2-amino-4-hydroxy-6- hydroxymethyldihydropteridine diphosphokinase n=1 Tax=Pantoea sp. Mhis TaxID=2576759 RepID=UPI00135940D5|nr:2-amino-4-hydroxy-6-hydroxymethyldihydropteridine diphosphokinase [Pantoea sp. Mhis]MXP56341.1 2-amino-4-hydroxy-6-hydroxymethyldihydropteridine diphosphokinase [Pantoea sp. Mhis]